MVLMTPCLSLTKHLGSQLVVGSLKALPVECLIALISDGSILPAVPPTMPMKTTQPAMEANHCASDRQDLRQLMLLTM